MVKRAAKKKDRARKKGSESACACGHSVEEHAPDGNYGGDASCKVDGCDCIAYERAD
jgi:hypothetical protein